MKFQDALQLALITCLVFVLIVFLWLVIPAVTLVRDPSTRWPHLRVCIVRPPPDTTSVSSTQRSLRRMIQRRNRQESQETNQEPLPKYSLRGQPGAGVSLQLGSPVVIDERDSGSIVVRSVQPVVAIAGIPIALPEEGENATRRERSRSSAAELYVEPVSPGIAPSGVLPVVHVTLSLPPPPGYNDKSGVPIEFGEPVPEGETGLP